MDSGISIVIPTWKGLHLLRENLPAVLDAARFYREKTGGDTELIVVDDGSSDETTSALPDEFPEARLIAKPQNEGFAITCNVGFQHCQLPVMALLNNDVRVERDYLFYLAEHFRDPLVFAVTSRVLEWDGATFSAGGRVGRFRRGFWSVYFNYDTCGPDQQAWIEEHRLLSAYAIGGFAAYDRAKVAELGGFTELLSPFNWEDVDLSYRGWKRGWEVHYEPRSVAYHRISATIGAHYQKKRVEAVSFRNRLLFHWINCHSPVFLASHLLMLALLTLTRFLVFDFSFYRSVYEGWIRLPEVRRLRRRERARARRTDAQLCRVWSRFYKSAPIRIYYGRAEVLQARDEK